MASDEKKKAALQKLEVSMEQEGRDRFLVIRLKMENPPRPSTSGKTLVVATTNGNQQTGCEIEGMAIHVGVNAFIKPPRE